MEKFEEFVSQYWLIMLENLYWTKGNGNKNTRKLDFQFGIAHCKKINVIHLVLSVLDKM